VSGSPSRPKIEETRELLYRKLKELGTKALSANGQIAAEDTEALGRLARLVEIHEVARPRRHNRFPVAAALVLTISVVSTLLFGRRRETEVELDANVSEVGFTLPQRQLLTHPAQLAELGASGLIRIELPLVSRAKAPPGEASSTTIRLSVAPAEGRTGSITLGDIMVPEDTSVWLRATSVPHQYRLSLSRLSTVIRVTVHGNVQIGAKPSSFPTPKTVLLNPDPGGVDLDLIFQDRGRVLLSPQLLVKDLRLFRHDTLIEGGQTVARTVSTVQGGALYFEEINGRERRLRSGDGIRFGWSHGMLRTAQMDDGHVRVQFRGRVRGMSTGAVESRTDLMPTLLEWLSARHGLVLLWGTTLYGCSLIIGILRWWGMGV